MRRHGGLQVNRNAAPDFRVHKYINCGNDAASAMVRGDPDTARISIPVEHDVDGRQKLFLFEMN